MNFEELLKACADGMVEVRTTRPIKYSTSDVGRVTILKQNSRWKGCAIQFPPFNYDHWFGDEPTATDKRSHYMHELEFIK